MLLCSKEIYLLDDRSLSFRQVGESPLDHLGESPRRNTRLSSGMMRRFAMAAHAVPKDSEALAVYRNLLGRLFIGRLSPVPIIVMMAFFEGLIQRFISFLAEIGKLQGSADQEYTDVHGVCDVGHTQELFRALEAEMALAHDSPEPATNLFEGVDLLKTLIQSIV